VKYLVFAVFITLHSTHGATMLTIRGKGEVVSEPWHVADLTSLTLILPFTLLSQWQKSFEDAGVTCKCFQ